MACAVSMAAAGLGGIARVLALSVAAVRVATTIATAKVTCCLSLALPLVLRAGAAASARDSFVLTRDAVALARCAVPVVVRVIAWVVTSAPAPVAAAGSPPSVPPASWHCHASAPSQRVSPRPLHGGAHAALVMGAAAAADRGALPASDEAAHAQAVQKTKASRCRRPHCHHRRRQRVDKHNGRGRLGKRLRQPHRHRRRHLRTQRVGRTSGPCGRTGGRTRGQRRRVRGGNGGGRRWGGRRRQVQYPGGGCTARASSHFSGCPSYRGRAEGPTPPVRSAHQHARVATCGEESVVRGSA